MRKMRWSKSISMFLVACLFGLSLVTGPGVNAQRRRNPEAGKKKAAKRIGIGAAIGAGAGGLIGGRKGALVGAGVGAGGGTLYHIHKKRKYERRRRR
jgi:hypothetical protein